MLYLETSRASVSRSSFGSLHISSGGPENEKQTIRLFSAGYIANYVSRQHRYDSATRESKLYTVAFREQSTWVDILRIRQARASVLLSLKHF